MTVTYPTTADFDNFFIYGIAQAVAKDGGTWSATVSHSKCASCSDLSMVRHIAASSFITLLQFHI